MSKLTKRLVESLSVDEGDKIFWDSELAGFGLRVYATGRKVYLVQYRAKGRSRRKALGKHGVLTADEARKEARLVQADVARGGDPSGERSALLRGPTIKDLSDRFLSEHVAHHCKPSTHYDYTGMFKNLINPALGHIKISEITRADIVAFHHNKRDVPYRANRAVSVLSKMLTVAEDWGIRPQNSNPATRIKKYREEEKKRYLSDDEQARLGNVLFEGLKSGDYSEYVVAAFYLLLLTGCRLREIQTLQWAFVTNTHLELPDSKTGRRRIPLPLEAREVLAALPRREGNPYVILGDSPDGHYNDLQKPWRKIRATAHLNDVRLHDLRHTYASVAVTNGIDPFMLKEILGHKNLSTTLRYSHLADDAVQRAAGSIASRMASAIRNHDPSPPALRVVR